MEALQQAVAAAEGRAEQLKAAAALVDALPDEIQSEVRRVDKAERGARRRIGELHGEVALACEGLADADQQAQRRVELKALKARADAAVKAQRAAKLSCAQAIRKAEGRVKSELLSGGAEELLRRKQEARSGGGGGDGGGGGAAGAADGAEMGREVEKTRALQQLLHEMAAENARSAAAMEQFAADTSNLEKVNDTSKATFDKTKISKELIKTLDRQQQLDNYMMLAAFGVFLLTFCYVIFWKRFAYPLFFRPAKAACDGRWEGIDAAGKGTSRAEVCAEAAAGEEQVCKAVCHAVFSVVQAAVRGGKACEFADGLRLEVACAVSKGEL